MSVLVGPTPCNLFHIHESDLRSSSPTLKNAFNPCWKESDDNAITLPECDREAFGVYAKWLYNGRVGISTPGNDITETNANGEARDHSYEWLRWEKCYILADYLQDSDFKNALIDTAIELIKPSGRAWESLGATIYEHSRMDSPHQRFAMHATASGLSMEKLETLAKEAVCEAFVVNLFMGVARVAREEKDLVEKIVEGCVYHGHGGDGGECHKVKHGWMY